MIRIAHRGASAYELENSLKAIYKAFEFEVDFIEMDIQSSSDGRLVIFHDHNLDRCTNTNGPIINRTFDELKSRVRLNNGEKIPSLTEICEILEQHGIPGIFELKNDNTAIRAYKEISAVLSTRDFVIGSFFHKQLLELKDEYPVARTCAMLECYPIELKSYLERLKVDYVALGFESTNEEMITEIKSAKVKSLVWTLNEEKDIQDAISLNVDGIISNYPDRIPKD